MFGKPHWFRPKAIGWGIAPVSWQGWIYAALWVGAIAGPFVLLLGRYQPLEALAWMGLGIGALAFDVRQILHTMRVPMASTVAAQTSAQRENNVLYILDDDQPHPRVATRGYNLQMK
ncbi:MAG: hypothetical protein WD872_11620 [Pirellulaceae bacterium]